LSGMRFMGSVGMREASHPPLDIGGPIPSTAERIVSRSEQILRLFVHLLHLVIEP